MSIHTIPNNYQPSQNLLHGKNILITGAGDGIGRCAALSFAAHGASVILLGKTEEKLASVYDQIESNGWPQPALIPLDLNTSDYNQYLTVKKAVEEHIGCLHGLLHNAGILGQRTTIADSKPEDWLKVMQVNINSVFLLTKALLPALSHDEKSSIVMTSSGVGRKGRAYWGAYSVSKFATEGLMQVLADEMSLTNIRVNCINPGATRTRMRAQAYPAENPLDLPTPEQLMTTYLYLMGGDSHAENGKTFDAQ